jgi:hypothetical protein
MSIRPCAYAIFCAAAALAVAAPAAAFVATLTPASGPPTTVVTLTGSGFPDSSLVDIYWDTTQISFGSTTGTGTLTPVSINVPAAAAPGTHYVTVKNDGAAGGAQAAFLIRTNWAAYRWSAAQRNYNPTENTLTPATIGDIEWNWTAAVSAGHQLIAPPLVISGFLYALDGQGDLSKWSLSTHARTWGIPTGIASANGITSSGGNIVISGAATLRAYKETTGALVWTAAVGGSGGSVSTPTVVAGVAYVFAEGSSNPGLYAYSVTCGTAGATCQPLWVGTGGSTTSSSSWGAEAAPTVANSVVVANPFAGPMAWRTDCIPTAGSCAQFWSAASNNYESAGGAYAAGYFWVPASSGQTVAALGMLCNDSPCFAVKTLNDTSTSSYPVSIAGTALFLSTNAGLQRFSTVCASSPCSPLESYAAPPGGTGPTVAGGLVFVGGENEIWAYNRTCVSCGPIWAASARVSGLNNSAVVADGTLYIPDQSGVLVYNLSAAASQIVAHRVAPPLSSLHPDRSFANIEAVARQRLPLGLPIKDLQPKATPAADEED